MTVVEAVMQDLALHILDVAENSVRAGASLIEIRVTEDTPADLLRIEIIDNGRGMDAGTCANVLSPFTTSRTERHVGLGLPLLAQAAREAEGECRVESRPGEGTQVVATFRHGHIDRKPVGDLSSTFETLAIGNPGIDFVLELCSDGETQRLDTRDLRGGRATGD